MGDCKFILVFLLGSVFLTSIVCGLNKKRNVLIFYADDGGFLQSAYNNSICDTPNLDKLASRSLVFQNGYTSVSSCSPSRSVLLTGLPQHQNGMYGLHHGVNKFNSFDQVKSLPVILSNNGVRTGLIGKKHVGPDDVYKFDFERSSEQYNINQIGRNLTFMKHFVNEFLNQDDDRPFLLYIAFFDTHRASTQTTKYGPFMNFWGSRLPGMGNIPDWTPHFYDPLKVKVPFFLPDTPATRNDLSAMYTSFNRMDQGIGLFLSELEKAGHLDDTLILFSADNGIPFPDAKTNLYDPGMGVPILISSPIHRASWGKFSDANVNTMDFVPTILHWMDVPYPLYHLNGHKVQLSGHSLLSLLDSSLDRSSFGFNFNHTFSSHNLHEITMYYPMRVIRSDQYRLIHNLNSGAPYPVATDIFSSPTFQDILHRYSHGVPTRWFKTLRQYYHRSEWELYDLKTDPEELDNLAYNASYQDVVKELSKSLTSWQRQTNDPWVCFPHADLINGQCLDLYNENHPM